MAIRAIPFPATGELAAPGKILAGWLAGLRYAVAGGRDYRLDLLRGFCVFAMIVDHISGSSWLYGLTGNNRWAVSAGEGFVFLSGLVLGMVYTRKMLKSGLGEAVWGLLRRARTLYLATVALTLSFAVLASFTELSLWLDRAAGLGYLTWTEIIVSTLTLHYSYHGSEILVLYTLLLLLAPGALFLMREGKTHWVLGASWLLWAGYALFPAQLGFWEIRNSHYFPLPAWQVLFVTGMAIGYHRSTAEARGGVHWSQAVSRVLPWVVAGAALLLAVAWLREYNPAELLPPSSYPVTGLEHEPLAHGVWDKISLGPGRLVAFALVAGAAYVLATFGWGPLQRSVGWLLVPLGAQALGAYWLHFFLIVVGYNLLGLGQEEPGLIAFNTFGQLGLVLAVWALVQAPATAPQLWARLRGRPDRSPRRQGLRLVEVGQRVAGRTGGLAACLALTLLVLLSGCARAVAAPLARPVDQAPVAPAMVDAVAPAVVEAASPMLEATELVNALGAVASEPTRVSPAVELVTSMSISEVAALVQQDPAPLARMLPGGMLLPRALFSPALERLMPYYVYLPPGYHDSDQQYPVLYLLHGYYGSFIEWSEIGIHEWVDEMILAGRIQPMIIIMPEGEQSYFFNHAENGPRWADYVVNDVVAAVDANYRTLPEARFRAVGGLSMGGFGALQLAFSYPDVFGIVGGHAPTLRWERPWDKPYFGDDEYYESVNPLVLAETQDVDALSSLLIWLDVGEEDWDWFTVEALHDILAWYRIPHEFTYLPGGHAAEYWIDHQGIYLDFYDRAFSAQRAAAEDQSPSDVSLSPREDPSESEAAPAISGTDSSIRSG